MRATGALLVGILLLAAGVLWWRTAGGDTRGAPDPVASSAAEAPREPARAALAVPEDVSRAEPSAASAPALEDSTERVNVPVAQGPRTRAPVRGRLVIAASGAPLDEVLTLRLRTGDLSLAETLVSAADGSFTSTLAFPRGFVLLKVLRPDGGEAADVETRFDPASDEEWLVQVPWPTFVHGVVCDLRGEPLRRVLITALPHGAAASDANASSDRDGEFLLQGLQPGPHTISFQHGLERRAIELHVGRGPNELGVLRLDLGRAIEGRLVAEDGEPGALLILSDGRHSLAAQEASGREAKGESAFRFEGVPPGEYRLEILPYDGRRYRPSAARVTSPGRVDFRAVGVQNRFEVRAVDASGEPLGVSAVVKLRGQWMDDLGFARADVEAWIVLGEEHRPARGGRPESDVVEVRLEPGHGEVFLFLEASSGERASSVECGRPLEGVELLVAERVVAWSDASGVALLDLPSPPASVEYRLSGWRPHKLSSRGGPLSTILMERE